MTLDGVEQYEMLATIDHRIEVHTPCLRPVNMMKGYSHSGCLVAEGKNPHKPRYVQQSDC